MDQSVGNICPHARNLASVGWGRIGELALLLSKTTYSLVSHDEAGNPSQSILWALIPAPTSVRPPSHISFVQHSARSGGSGLRSNTVADVAMDVAAAQSPNWTPRSIYDGWLLFGGQVAFSRAILLQRT